MCAPFPANTLIRNQACAPKQSQPSVVQASARVMPPALTEPSSGAWRSTRSTRSRPNLMILGCRQIATSGVMASTHQ